MAKDNKITVMPKVKSDFDKFSRTVEEASVTPLLEVKATPEGTTVTDTGEVAVSITETMKGTATFNRGGTMPDIVPKEGADPLHVECLTLFRRLIAGGYITPWALPVLMDVDKMIAKLKDTVEVKNGT